MTRLEILLIEDEALAAENVAAALAHVGDCHVARSRSSALTALEATDREFDLIVCDLKIPVADDELTVSEEHGMRVHDVATAQHSGTHCVFLTGYPDIEEARSHLAKGRTGDVFGGGDTWPLVDLFGKHQMDRLVGLAERIAAELEELERIGVIAHPPLVLSDRHRRLLRIYARKLSATSVDAYRLGGLSGATVVRASLQVGGVQRAHVVVKLDTIDENALELAGYQKWVAPLLTVGRLSHLVEEISMGAGRQSAVIYGLASDWRDDLFDVMRDAPDGAGEVVRRLFDNLEPWRNYGAERSHTVRDLRAARVRDDQLLEFESSLRSLGSEHVESLEISFRTAVQHCDLHGRNILVNRELQPVLIDYGTVTEGPGALDPVTLELSSCLHSEHPDLGWPTPDVAAHWFDLDTYLHGCPIPGFVTACRDWAVDAVGDPVELAATVYVHAVRQLKYPDTDKDLALAIAGAACAMIAR